MVLKYLYDFVPGVPTCVGAIVPQTVYLGKPAVVWTGV